MKLQGTSGRIAGMSLCEDLGSLFGNGHTISFPNTYLQGDTKLLWPLAKKRPMLENSEEMADIGKENEGEESFPVLHPMMQR